MSRLWVAGATGFLGSHLARVLVERGEDVIAVARTGGLAAGVSVASVDVMDAKAVRESARGAEGAFFAAGKVSRDPADAEELHRFHVEGTLRAFEALREAGVRRVVYAGTSGTIAVSRDSKSIANEQTRPPLELISRWPYYRAKHYAERAVLALNEPGRFEVIVVNPSLLLGPGDTRGSSTDDVRRFLDGDVLATPRGGLAFVDVRDAAEAMANAYRMGAPGQRYLLAAANLTIDAFIGRLSRLSGVRRPRVRLPASPELAVMGNQLFNKAVQALGGKPPLDDVSVEMAQHFWYCDSTRAQRELGFLPRDPAITLRDTIADLRGEYAGD